MQRLWIIVVALVAVGLSAAVATAQNPHFVGQPICVLSEDGDTVTCTGKIAGVGKVPVDVTAVIPGGCANKPGHQPPGQVTATEGDIVPRGGRINFNVSLSLDCPPGLTPVFGDEATIFVDETFVGTVPIT